MKVYVAKLEAVQARAPSVWRSTSGTIRSRTALADLRPAGACAGGCPIACSATL
jgi:hypothetical protein